MPAPLPPVKGPEDYRTFAGKKAALTFESKLVVRDVQGRTESWSELGMEHPDLFEDAGLPKASLNDDVDALAAAERSRLGVKPLVQIDKWKSADEAFKRWRLKVEDQGVFVYVEKFPSDDCRGFSIVDRGVLAVVVNDNEWVEGAKVFTLFHEYAHVLLRRGGICLEQPTSQVERFCNRFASAFLLPSKLVSEVAARLDGAWTDDNLKAGARLAKVSISAFVLRLEALNRVPNGTYDRLREEWESRPARPRPATPSRARVTWAQKRLKRFGSRHVTLALRALEKHFVSKVDAYELLALGSRHYDEFRQRLQSLRRNFAA
jgi:Zn-dependent peptidase ImmA (M78 family)